MHCGTTPVFSQHVLTKLSVGSSNIQAAIALAQFFACDMLKRTIVNMSQEAWNSRWKALHLGQPILPRFPPHTKPYSKGGQNPGAQQSHISRS
jgi:hypothetical protein